MSIEQTIISALFTLFGVVLSYFVSLKKIDAEVEKTLINSTNEINKIREEAQKEIDKIKAESSKEINKIKTEHEEYRKSNKFNSKLNRIENKENMANEFTAKFLNDFMENSSDGLEKFDSILMLQKKIPKKSTKN